MKRATYFHVLTQKFLDLKSEGFGTKKQKKSLNSWIWGKKKTGEAVWIAY